jgi:hypothetical protein
MTSQRPDEDLHAAFQAERAAERRRVPSYAMVAAGRIAARPRPATKAGWLLLGGALAAVVSGLWLVHQAKAAHELELARSVMEVESPTSSLLPPPSSLLDSIPRLGHSVPGSPLRSLDPGGPLGPPLTRSPRI